MPTTAIVGKINYKNLFEPCWYEWYDQWTVFNITIGHRFKVDIIMYRSRIL